MSTDAQETVRAHGGRLIARRLKAHGVNRIFTLSGGHLFSLYEGCRAEGIEIVDTRHEATAAFAAEGWAKVTREPGVAALTAGPGVTNGMSAMAERPAEPLADGGAGRARAGHALGAGLAAGDRPRAVRAPGDQARGHGRARRWRSPGWSTRRSRWPAVPHTGPVFLDFPLDVVFMEADVEEAAEPAPLRAGRADGDAVARAIALLDDAERPVIMAGTNLYWGRGEDALRELAESRGIPVFLNGLARGCLPADHPLFFARARSAALKSADVALVIGVPMDFRLGFGAAFGEETELIAIDVAEPEREHPRPVAAELYGELAETLTALAGAGHDTSGWVGSLRDTETEKRAAEREQLEDGRAPLHPMRVYGELAQVLDRDAIVIGDGGDFVSYAGRVVDSYQPGCWLDPGPYGCLGSGPGYALAAKLAHPDRQVVLLLGDGAFGFSGLEYDTLARHGVNVVGVMGNNGHLGAREAPDGVPLPRLVGGGRPAAGDALRPGGRGARRPRRARARRRTSCAARSSAAFASGLPALVNVLTDPLGRLSAQREPGVAEALFK